MPTTKPPPTLLSRAEVAARWGLHINSIYRRTEDGTLPVVRIGTNVRIPLAAVEAIEAAATATTKEA